MKCSFGISYFHESLVFPILLFSSIPLNCSLRKTFLSPLAIVWNSAFKWVHLFFSLLSFTSLLFSAICKTSSDNHLAFLHFFFFELVLITDSCTCHKPLSIVLQALCLSELIPWIYFSLPLYNHKGFDLGHTWMTKWFSLLSSIIPKV